MKVRLIVSVLLGMGLTQAASQVHAQEPAVPAAPPVEAVPPAAPELAPEAVPLAPLPTEVPIVDAAPGPVAEAAPAEEVVELTAEELAAMGLSTEAGSSAAPGVDTSLKLSGFADVGLLSPAIPKSNPFNGAGSVNRHTSFYVGNLNLYIGKNITESVRMFGEVRFTLLPNGAPDPTTTGGKLINTSVSDYSDFGRPIQWAGINIQRLYLEWTANRALVFRVGQYLTPYGIWNVDHGSPTIVPVQKPYIIGQQLFPERQTGLEVLGQFDASAHNSLGYHLTISNGTGPVVAYRDFDGNKAVTGRGWWRFDGFGELRVGVSGYYGRYTDAIETPGLASDGVHVSYKQKIISSYDALSLAGDVKWTYGGFLFQSEVVTQQRKYRDGARPGAFNPLAGQYIAPNDKLSWGVYGLMGYRFDWYGVMPYIMSQGTDTSDPVNSSYTRNVGFSAGLNIRPIDSLVFKFEYDEAHFPKGSLIGNDPVRLIQAQIAWAF